ncbi:uncharacterized protein LOC141723347 [Apium graveolens]|uniref:uncharacterized protein LOC141723347 n=1 Tax=Apium graveolens TaxID=4045 RepID=UPI003D78FFFA
MGHCIIILVLCIVSSVLFSCCDSLQLSSSANNDLGIHAASDHDYQLTYPGVLPRKLKLRMDGQLLSVRKVHNRGDQDSIKNMLTAGKAQNKEITKRKLQGPIKTWRECVEAQGSDDTASQYFTMDYSRVRRRRPIHNKSLRAAP